MHEWILAILAWLEQLSYWGIMIGLMIEVIPSEIVLSYGGYLVSQGQISFAGAVVFGTIGGTLAQIFVYWIGKYGGRPFLEKYGKFIFINKRHIDVAEKWFDRYGTGVIFTARFVPVARHAVSIPAGIANMPLGRFTVLTTLAVIPWSVFFIWLGMTLGEQWERIDEAAGPYVTPVMIAAAALMVVYVVSQWIKSGKRKRRKVVAREAGIREAGAAGERETAHQLSYIGREYVTFHGIKLRGGGRVQEFDHFVIGPNGVFHLETKHWKGKISFEKNGLFRDGEPAADPTAQLYRHEYVLKELLRSEGQSAEVHGLLVFTHPQATVQGKPPAFTAVRADRLVHEIRERRSKRPLSKADIQRIAGLVRNAAVK